MAKPRKPKSRLQPLNLDELSAPAPAAQGRAPTVAEVLQQVQTDVTEHHLPDAMLQELFADPEAYFAARQLTDAQAKELVKTVASLYFKALHKGAGEDKFDAARLQVEITKSQVLAAQKLGEVLQGQLGGIVPAQVIRIAELLKE